MKTVSEGQYFMTIHVEIAKLGCPGPCREYVRYLEIVKNPGQKDGFGGIQKMVRHWKSQ